MSFKAEEGNIHSDEYKIKQQIKLDVTYFVDNVRAKLNENELLLNYFCFRWVNRALS